VGLFASAMSSRPGQLASRALVDAKHLLNRTFKNMRRNFVFLTLYCWCTVVFLRALTGAGYEESHAVKDAERPSLLYRIERDFLPDKAWTRRTKEVAGSKLDALLHSRGRGHEARKQHMYWGQDREVAPDDKIGLLIFGEPTSATLAKPTPKNEKDGKAEEMMKDSNINNKAS